MSQFSGIRCIVFDIDDTLYLERDYVRSGFEAVESHSGVVGLAEECWRLFSAGVRGNTFNRALEALDRRGRLCEQWPDNRKFVANLVDCYRAHKPAVELLPDALACLEGLEGRLQACITDGPLLSQRAKVDALHLPKWLDPIIVTAEIGPDFSKPHPRAFEMVQRITGLDAPMHVYVADNPVKDFLGARACGWRTVRIRRPLSLCASEPTEDRADAELQSLSPLPGLLRE